ncbi:hypothetical protein A1F94_009935 [Pyrenophora tritici-repentis]|nr:hypothetical protein A1F94_009935 [Pyrenophora tritici-repentis]
MSQLCLLSKSRPSWKSIIDANEAAVPGPSFEASEWQVAWAWAPPPSPSKVLDNFVDDLEYVQPVIRQAGSNSSPFCTRKILYCSRLTEGVKRHLRKRHLSIAQLLLLHLMFLNHQERGYNKNGTYQRPQVR